MSSLPLPDVAVWRLTLRLAPGDRVRSWSERLHSRLGPALHARACALDCGAGLCRLGEGCAFARCYGADVPRTFRVDSADLDVPHATRPSGLRIVSLASPDEGLLLACLPEALAPHTVVVLDRLAHGGDDPPVAVTTDALDLGPRADALTGEVHVELRSISALKRDGRRVENPTALDLLHSARLRAHRLGVDVSAFPTFEDEIAAPSGDVRPAVRLHASRGAVAAIPGVHARLHLTATPGQAAWLALAEVIGVGGKTALGFGVVRVVPASV